MALTNSKGAADAPAAAAAGREYSDRDLLVAILHAVCALADRLGGGPLVIKLHSEKTGRELLVHGSDGAGFAASVPDRAVPLHAALGRDG